MDVLLRACVKFPEKSTNGAGTEVSWFCKYTVTSPVLFPEKMAPKMRIRITGNIKPKNKPATFLKYPRPKRRRSDMSLFPLAISVPPLSTCILLGFDFSMFVDGSAHQAHEHVLQTVTAR